MKYYLAYGSNLNKKQMAFRCPGAKVVGTAHLTDYRLLYRGSKTGSYLTVEPKKGCKVPVGVWQINEEHEQSLDRYEGYPTFYRKETITLPCYFTKKDTVKTVEAIIYIMNEHGPYGMPSFGYELGCKAGYEEFGFDPVYLENAITDTRELMIGA